MANEFVKGYSTGQLVGFFRSICAELRRRGLNPRTVLDLEEQQANQAKSTADGQASVK